jgi:probable phosphoglycerate mutase
MSIKQLVFIRPGETSWNRLGRWQGQVAVPLNEHGRIQAERLARFIRPIGLNSLYTSDLVRAAETAQIIGQPIGLTPTLEKRLRERHIGIWQGLTPDEVATWYPEEFRQLQQDPDGYQIAGGESRRQVVKRVQAVLDDIMARGSGQTVGIVSHSTAMRAIISALIPEFDPYDHDFSNISVTTLRHDEENDTWKITQINDLSHLEGMEALSVGEVEDDV